MNARNEGKQNAVVDPDTMAQAADALRLRGVFGGEEDAEAVVLFSPLAEQHYLAALASLEQAERQFKLAGLHETAWIGAGRGSR